MSHVTFTNRKSIGNVVGQLKNRRQKTTNGLRLSAKAFFKQRPKTANKFGSPALRIEHRIGHKLWPKWK